MGVNVAKYYTKNDVLGEGSNRRVDEASPDGKEKKHARAHAREREIKKTGRPKSPPLYPREGGVSRMRIRSRPLS